MYGTSSFVPCSVVYCCVCADGVYKCIFLNAVTFCKWYDFYANFVVFCSYAILNCWLSLAKQLSILLQGSKTFQGNEQLCRNDSGLKRTGTK